MRQLSRLADRAGGPDVLLAAAAVLTFVLIPIHINTIWEGLPAHPLFVHVPVILIPTVALGGLLLAARPGLVGRHGVWLSALTVVALGALNLTMGAGDELRDDLGLENGTFGVAELIRRHEHAASILRLLMIVFTVLFIGLVALMRRSGPPSGVLLGRVALFVVGAFALYFVWKTGDLGARAVWAGRVHGFGGGFGGGGFPGRSGGGGGGGGSGSGLSGLFGNSGAG
jgi:hypothetical protein